jgi:hypothetical protein
LLGKVLRQGNRHSADAATHVEHSMVRLQPADVDEMTEKFLANRLESGPADEI